MSYDALRWAFALHMTDASAKAVLIALADHADDEGRCWPAAERLCQFTALADRTVRGALQRLADMGAITLQERKGKSPMCSLRREWEGQPRQELPDDEGGNPGRKCRTRRQHLPDSGEGGAAASAGPPRQDLPDTPAANAATPAASADEPPRTTKNHPVEPPSGETRNAPRREAAGTRLDPAWLPDADDRAYAEERGLNPDVVGEEFRNFWVGVPGARGRKLDWKATFRNRCIQLAGTARPRSASHHPGGNGAGLARGGDGIAGAAQRVMQRRGLVGA